ncbi:ATP-binding protein, partial [Actinomadura adrarensis]
MGAAGLYGRKRETDLIAELLAKARAGTSSALVVRGEPGIGKTALLGHAAAAAGNMRLLHGSGVESEAELPFSGLQLL